MHDFVLAMQLEGRDCLVVGGGRVASTKAADLLASGAHVTIVAPDVAQALHATGATVHARPYAPDDLDRRALVFAATDDAPLNRRIAEECRARGVPCCNVSEPVAGDFTTPAHVRRGPVTVAVSTSGAAPALAKRLRAELDAWLPEDLGPYAAFLEHARATARTRVADPAARRSVAARLASAEGYETWRALDDTGRAAWLESTLSEEEGNSG